MVQISIAAMGLFSATRQGLDGAILLLLSQGLVAGGLIFSAGILLTRTQTTRLDAFGGLSIRMPVFSALLLLVIWTALGLPGSTGFVAMFLTLTGLVAAAPWAAVVALIALGVLAGALLNAFRKIMRGDLLKETLKSVEDLNARERFILLPLVAVIVALGLYPGFVTERIGGSTDMLAALFDEERAAATQASRDSQTPSQHAASPPLSGSVHDPNARLLR